MIAAVQLFQALLLRVLPAVFVFSCFTTFKDFEPTPEYQSSGAFVLLGGMWFFSGPAWRTANPGVRWRAWLHALAFSVVIAGSGMLFFFVLRAHWAGLWILLLGVATLALGPEEPKTAVAPVAQVTAPLAAPIAPSAAPVPTIATSRRRRTMGYAVAGIGFIGLLGFVSHLINRPGSIWQVIPIGESAEEIYARAWRYREGDGVPQDFALAATYFQHAADRGLAEAQYDLAVLQENGLGVTVDLAEARFNYLQAAEHHYAPALTRLGMFALADGDWPTAIADLENAARLGDHWAEYGLGSAHLSRRSESEGSIVDALVWLELARQHGVEPVKGLLQHVWATVPDDDCAWTTDTVRRRVEEELAAKPGR